MARRRRRASCLAIALTGLGLAGCSTGVPASDLAELSASFGAALLGHQSDGPAAGGDGAQLVGTLEATDGCVIVRVADGTVVIPSFPIGWTEVDASGALTWGGDTAAHLGDAIELGGGYVDVSTVEVPDGCEADEAFIVTPLES